MRIIVVGSLFKQGEGYQHCQALRSMGHEVIEVSDTPYNFRPGENYQPSFEDRIRHKLLRPKDYTNINQRLVEACHHYQPDIIWVFKCLVLKSSVIAKLKKQLLDTKFIWSSGDDMYARHNQSVHFKKSLPLYDLVFTNKSYNCHSEELPSLGAQDVRFVPKSFDPDSHYPVTVNEEDQENYGAEVSFVGTYEDHRAQKMHYLAKNGIDVRIWGNNWDRCRYKHPGMRIENRPVYLDQYQKTIAASKINLCFLRKLNRDLHTNRSIEIPAIGGFMLAERSQEHQQLFEEGVEAEFFDSDNDKELLDKVHYYLQHDAERQAIALNGYKRCYASDYSCYAQVRNMLEQVLIKFDNLVS